MTDCDVVVIGAGAAGLRCAAALSERGWHVIVLEASDEVGGRIRSDRVDGFICDRGFQVLNPSYPQVRRHLDTQALGLGAFGAGLLARTDKGIVTVADPVREPRLLARTLRSGLLDVRDLPGLTRWLAPALTSPQRSLHAPDAPLGEQLTALQVTGALRRTLDRFIAGVLVDSHGQTSATYTRILLRSFALARPSLPADGMGGVPAQLATHVNDIRLNTPVDRISEPNATGTEIIVEGPDVRLSTRAVVLAVDPDAATHLTGQQTPRMHGLTTWWFDAPNTPHGERLLLVDVRGTDKPPGPVWNTAVVTNIAPTYAPPQRCLIQATTLLDQPDGDAPEQDVRTHLSSLYRTDTSTWQVITRHRIPHAVPEQPSPLILTKAPQIRPLVFVCGDHRDTASLQGALASGSRIARHVHSDLSPR